MALFFIPFRFFSVSATSTRFRAFLSVLRSITPSVATTALLARRTRLVPVAAPLLHPAAPHWPRALALRSLRLLVHLSLHDRKRLNLLQLQRVDPPRRRRRADPGERGPPNLLVLNARNESGALRLERRGERDRVGKRLRCGQRLPLAVLRLLILVCLVNETPRGAALRAHGHSESSTHGAAERPLVPLHPASDRRPDQALVVLHPIRVDDADAVSG